ncbi:LacI family DNA-binding transcriptional regulator [Algihabitans albus]|uniref:LacI family DNA-binding transcriptional regulator n=1 Tax=Algihabitans albus TaxID=2164067 RepID=UPI000E5D1CA7|nr:LacI family DNA-binding transcriptional regulator [Algihabitans albus]
MPSEPKHRSSLKSNVARTTAADVARAAGVSISAVSRAFTANASIAKGTKTRVLKAADALGYQPNPLARGLITRRSGMIALLMTEVTNPFYPTVLETFARALSKRGKHVMLFTPAEDEPLEALLPRAFGYGVEGVVITSAKPTSEMMAACESAPVPVVLFNRTVESSAISAVCCDNEAGGRTIARFLAEGGRRRAAFVAGLAGASTSLYRERGFAAGLIEAGLSAPLRAEGHFTFDGGLKAAEHLLALEARPDAIFAANDIMALGVLDGLRRVGGLRVPEDIWVVGFDDIATAAWPSFGLTTFRQPINRMVAETLRILDLAETGAPGSPSTVLVPGRLIERGSTGALQPRS